MTKFSDPKTTWNGRYAGADGFLFGEQPNQWLSHCTALLKPGARVLCVADGEGRNGVWLAERGCQVTSFDLSDVGISKARDLARRKGVQLDVQQSDAAEWDWQPERYDAVVAIFIQFAAPALRARLFEGIRRTLVPGGLLIIEGYGPRQLIYKTGGPGVEDNLYTMQLLARGFDGWDVLASRDVDREVSEGAGHHGMSHLVSAVLGKP